jgi:hypothetical protein
MVSYIAFFYFSTRDPRTSPQKCVCPFAIRFLGDSDFGNKDFTTRTAKITVGFLVRIANISVD